MLTKEAIFKADDIKLEPVEVPEWGGTVYVRVMSGLDRDRWEGRLLGIETSKNFDNLRATLVAMTAADVRGDRLFQDADIPELGKKSSLVLGRLYDVALKLNGLTQEARADIEKNSDPSPGASSHTG